MAPTPSIDGWAALRGGDWPAAEAAFRLELAHGPSARALDGLGQALWWRKQVQEGLGLRSRAYALFRREGWADDAARIAAWLAREHLACFGNVPVATGWLARARRLAQSDAQDQVTHGWVLLAAACLATDQAATVGSLEESATIARAGRALDLEITALSQLGVAHIGDGSIEVGVGELDEAMAAAAAGEPADRRTIADVYCAMITAAELLGSNDRLMQWSAAVDHAVRTMDFGPLGTPSGTAASGYQMFSSFCGTCCGSIYLASGRIDEGEAELISAVADLERSGLRSRCIHPAAQLADLRVLQGRFEEAALLLAPHEDLAETVRPLAALEIAKGDAPAAAARLRSAIEDGGVSRVASFPLLLILAEAYLRAREIESAGRTVDSIEAISAETGSPRHAAEARFARARLQRARGDKDAAGSLRVAARDLNDVSAPLLASRARFELAQCVLDTDRGTAVTEARGALAAFDRLGAVADADVAASFLRGLGVAGRTGPKQLGVLSKRELEVLRLVAQGNSNAEIAQRLFISVKTAGHHVSNILAKLGLRSRTEAAAFAAVRLAASPAPARERALK